MVWTPVGWIDQGEDPDDFYAPVPDELFCKECGAKINPEPQILIFKRVIGYNYEFEFEDEVIFWECPRCMEQYESIED